MWRLGNGGCRFNATQGISETTFPTTTKPNDQSLWNEETSSSYLWEIMIVKFKNTKLHFSLRQTSSSLQNPEQQFKHWVFVPLIWCLLSSLLCHLWSQSASPISLACLSQWRHGAECCISRVYLCILVYWPASPEYQSIPARGPCGAMRIGHTCLLYYCISILPILLLLLRDNINPSQLIH